MGLVALTAGATASQASSAVKLTILHTNDVHSRIDPFDTNHPQFPGQGGASRRSALIRQIRSQEQNVLVFDSGDIFQGTPYFNMFLGIPEIRLMNHMGYHAATIGNHEFDGGLLNLSARIGEASFPFVCTNYNVTGTPIENQVVPYRVFQAGILKVGVIGLGIRLEGLVDSKLFGSVVYSDPIETGEQYARMLKKDKKCDLVIALSHLGYEYQNNTVSDKLLAAGTSSIDLILGGHTHTFLNEPVNIKNREGKNVLICQTGWGGVKLGRIDLLFLPGTSKKSFMISLM